ncbi:Gag-Pol polyprotein [Dictyocoela muelleri]|nr:Gag-Pol polyprotein [Dictyocoela muelleri]
MIQSITQILADYVRERILVDTVDLSAYSAYNDNFRYIFVMVDSFSKYAWAYPSLLKDERSFSLILRRNFYKEGYLSFFHSDNGCEFVNNLVTALLNQFNVKAVHGNPYHPESQRQVERLNRTLKSRLRKCMGETNNDWIGNLDRIIFLYND